MADTAIATTDKQEVVGPDGKKYRFSKNISKERIDKYFAINNIAKKDITTTSKVNEAVTYGDLYKHIQKPVPNLAGKAVAEYLSPGNTSAAGFVGSIVGGSIGASTGTPMGARWGATIGAAAFGALAEGMNQILYGVMFNEKIDNKKLVIDSMKEGVEQGLLQKGGEKFGEVFFKALSKIPHAAVKDGIPLLPSQQKEGSFVMKGIEDFFRNMYPSKGIMETFDANQSKIVSDKLETMAKSMANFKGTSEEMGLMLQKVMRTGEAEANKAVAATRANYIKNGHSAAQADAYLVKTNLYKNTVKEFRSQLAEKVISTNKPELIGGLLRDKGTSLEEARTMAATVKERDPKVWGKVQNRITRDIINEVFSGSKDPINKATQSITGKYSGPELKSILDGIGEEKLKTIYGEAGVKRWEDFIKLTGMIGGKKSGLGSMMNIFLFVGPIRSGINPKSVGKTLNLGFVINRMAKVITSDKGIELTNKIVRGTIANSPRLIKLALDEIRVFNKQSDEEYDREEQEGEQDYLTEHSNKNNKEKK